MLFLVIWEKILKIMDNEIEQIIANAIRLNPQFVEMTTQEQYDWIHNNLDQELIKEELVHYYDSKFEYINKFDYERYK